MTQTTEISRLKLLHPDLGHPGGSDLHGHIATAFTKLGDMLNARYFSSAALANGATATFEHNFKCAFSELKYLLYSWNTGTGELTRIVTGGSPDLADFAIVATPANLTTQINVTNNTGSAQDIALVLTQGKGAESIDELTDVDITSTAPQEGQSLVWATNKFVPGASGDSSFKLQEFSGNNIVVKAGYLKLSDGRELYAASDLTFAIGTPADGNYYVYVDLFALAGSPTVVGGRSVYPVTTSELALSTTIPESNNLKRYAPLGLVVRSGGAWTTFGTIAGKVHPIVNGLDVVVLDAPAVSGVNLLAGKHYIVSGLTADTTLNLPAGFAGANLRVTVINNLTSGFRVTLARAGSDTIAYGGTTTYTDAKLMYADSWLQLSWRTTYWAVDDASLPLTGTFSGSINFTGNITAANLKAPTITKYLSGSGTYTKPTDAVWLRVRMAGAGGGGAGSGTTNTGGAGGAGGNTTFGTAFLQADGGTGGNSTWNGGGGVGGGGSLGSAIGFVSAGGFGKYPHTQSSSTTPPNNDICGGGGGDSAFFGGAGRALDGPGVAGVANTGGGGAGAGVVSNALVYFLGIGGGGGGSLEAVIASPSASYAYSVGASGAAGTAGTGVDAKAGGAGGSGVIIIEEYYN